MIDSINKCSMTLKSENSHCYILDLPLLKEDFFPSQITWKKNSRKFMNIFQGQMPSKGQVG